MKKYAESVHQSDAQDLFLIMVNSPQQPMHVTNSFENKILEKTFKNLTWFFPLHSQSLFMDLIMKNKTGLKLVTWVSLGYKTCLENSFLVIYHLGDFDNIIQSRFWIIPKIALANLCKPIQDVIIILVSSEPLILKTAETKKKI